QRSAPVPVSPPRYVDVGDGHDGPLLVTGTSAVNTCAFITTASGTQIGVSSPTTGFAPGQRILLVQYAEGAFSVSGDPSPVTNPGRAGLWELSRITAVGAASLTAGAPLRRRYDLAALVCNVPEHTDVT